MAAASSVSTNPNDAENRIVGMMVGSAAADVAGIYTHNLSKQIARDAYARRRLLGSNKLPAHYPDEHRAQYKDGDWSEVTEMALCSLFSHLHDKTREQLPKRLHYLSNNGNREYDMLPLFLGQPLHDTIQAKDYKTDPIQIAWTRWANSDQGRNDRNGSNAPLVRLHPVAAFAAQQDFYWSIMEANVNCRTTHVDSRCSISVLIAVALLRGMIRQEVQTEKQINPLIQKCKKYIDYFEEQSSKSRDGEEIPAKMKGAAYSVSSWAELSRLLTVQSLKDLELDKANSQGEVWKCLSAGIFCLRTAMVRLERLSGKAREDTRKVLFANIINDLVLEGGAAQANAAFAGALLGAYLGYDAIPRQITKGLRQRKFLMGKCKLLCEFVGVIKGKKRREDSSGIGRSRNASERRAMQQAIKDQRKARLDTLMKRWQDRDTVMRQKRRTDWESLEYPSKRR